MLHLHVGVLAQDNAIEGPTLTNIAYGIADKADDAHRVAVGMGLHTAAPLNFFEDRDSWREWGETDPVRVADGVHLIIPVEDTVRAGEDAREYLKALNYAVKQHNDSAPTTLPPVFLSPDAYLTPAPVWNEVLATLTTGAVYPDGVRVPERV